MRQFVVLMDEKFVPAVDGCGFGRAGEFSWDRNSGRSALLKRTVEGTQMRRERWTWLGVGSLCCSPC